MPNELTNPNNVVTEERLAQFYQQILPYLGGMPDILANKFSKADLYSTDEKLIGRWIDGKPLYEKTVTGTTPSGSSWGEIADIGSNCHIIQGQVYVNIASNTVHPVPYGTGNIRCGFNYGNVNGKVSMNPAGDSDFTSKPFYAILKYTKTTDSAVEIGDDTDYSTTEKIVGTWIDGKPIWQKTIETTTPNKATIQYSPVGASIETVVNYVAMFKNTPSSTGLNNWIKAGSLASQLENLSAGLVVHVYGNDATAGTPNSVAIRHNADGWGGKPIYITVLYTKTSS